MFLTPLGGLIFWIAWFILIINLEKNRNKNNSFTFVTNNLIMFLWITSVQYTKTRFVKFLWNKKFPKFIINYLQRSLHLFALSKGQAKRTSTGALSVLTGAFTGRSPKDRYIVKDDLTESSIDWGAINIPFNPSSFDQLHKKMIEFISDKELL